MLRVRLASERINMADEFVSRANSCSSHGDCGINEFCDSYLVNGQCRTLLSDGSLCYNDAQCVNFCSAGVCSGCSADADCEFDTYCANKYVPFMHKYCAGYCETLCLTDSMCGSGCSKCGWDFLCHKP